MQEIHIVYASDDNFAEVLGVSLISLFEQHAKNVEFHIYILDSGISIKNKGNINNIFAKYERLKPKWYTATNICEELDMEITLDRGSVSQYARLFLTRVLPSELERVLYLDCDVIINNSILELWTLDMKGKTIAALLDAFSKQYRANIGLQENDIMFNSGVMLINLEKWRENLIEEKLIEFIVQNDGKIQQGDQGALNAILSKDTYCFDPKFNSVTIFYDFNYKQMLIYRKPPFYYTEQEINEAINRPIIIHYTTSFLSKRPWFKGSNHRYKDLWLDYRDKSPWKLEELKEYSYKNNIHRMYLIFCNIIPKKMMVYISGILQAYGRPWINKLKLNK